MAAKTTELPQGADRPAAGYPTSLPPNVEAELQALTWLNDDVLWAVARTRMNSSKQRRWRRLLEKNQRGTLTDPEGYTWTIATRKEDLTPDEMKKRQDEWMKNFAAQPTHS